MPRSSARTETPWALRPPRQARSRKTLQRIIDATEALLAEKTFDRVSVTEIVRQAHSSVGAFYARFRDKDTLLDHLDALFEEELVDAARRYEEDPRWSRAPLAELVGELVGFLVRFHIERRGLLRALLEREHGRRAPRSMPAGRRANPLANVLVQRVMAHRREIEHPNPELAARFGLAMVVRTIRERILFPESFAREATVTEGILRQELARAYLAYLSG